MLCAQAFNMASKMADVQIVLVLNTSKQFVRKELWERQGQTLQKSKAKFTK